MVKTYRPIPEYKVIDGKRYKQAGAYKSKSDASTRAVSLRKAGWDVRIHPHDTRTGTKYVHYRRKGR